MANEFKVKRGLLINSDTFNGTTNSITAYNSNDENIFSVATNGDLGLGGDITINSDANQIISAERLTVGAGGDLSITAPSGLILEPASDPVAAGGDLHLNAGNGNTNLTLGAVAAGNTYIQPGSGYSSGTIYGNIYMATSGGSVVIGDTTLTAGKTLDVNGSILARGGCKSGSSTSYLDYALEDTWLLKNFNKLILDVALDVDGDEQFRFFGGGVVGNEFKITNTGHVIMKSSFNAGDNNNYFNFEAGDALQIVNNTNDILQITGMDLPGDENFVFFGGGVAGNKFEITSNGDVNILKDLTVTGTSIFNDEVQLKGYTEVSGSVELVGSASITFNSTSYLRFVNLTASQILELDASKDVISVAKGTAYNKAFGTTTGTVSEGDHTHTDLHSHTNSSNLASINQDLATDDTVQFGALGIGVAPSKGLDVISSSGEIRMSSSVADATDKYLRLYNRHYLNTEDDTTLFFSNNQSSANALTIGGGTSLGNAVTSLHFYTATSTTTPTGTKQMEIGGSGIVTVNSGYLFVGVDDDTQGQFRLYGAGAGSTTGGRFILYTAADYDTTYGYFDLDVYQDTLRIQSEANKGITLKGDGGVILSEYAYIGGQTQITYQGETLRLLGESTTSYLTFFRDGSTRAGYIGFPGDNNEFKFESDKTDGTIKFVIDGKNIFYNDKTYTYFYNDYIYINEYIQHNGDTDTYLRFLDDQILMDVGGTEMLDMYEGTQDYFKINPSGGDVDFSVQWTGGDALSIAGDTGNVSIPENLDVGGVTLSTGVITMTPLTASTILELDASKQIISATKNTAYNKAFGTGSGTVCEGDDSRLSDARTPTSHNNTYHSETYITSTGVTYENLNTNSDVGTGASQVAAGNHTHTSFSNLSITGELDISGNIKDEFTAGETVAAGDLCYYKSDGKMWKADASAEATSTGMLAIAGEAVTASSSGTFYLWGPVTTTGLTTADILYVSETAADVTGTAPTTASAVVRVIGYALSTTSFLFKPDNTWVTI